MNISNSIAKASILLAASMGVEGCYKALDNVQSNQDSYDGKEVKDYIADTKGDALQSIEVDSNGKPKDGKDSKDGVVDASDVITQSDTNEVQSDEDVSEAADTSIVPAICAENTPDICIQTLQKIICAAPCLNNWLYEQRIQEEADHTISTLKKMFEYAGVTSSTSGGMGVNEIETKDFIINNFGFATGNNGIYAWEGVLIKNKADGTKTLKISYNNNPQPSGESGINWPTDVASIQFKINADGTVESLKVDKPIKECKEYYPIPSSPNNNRLQMVRSGAVSSIVAIEYQPQFDAGKCESIKNWDVDPMDIKAFSDVDTTKKTCKNGDESVVYCGTDPGNSGKFKGLAAGIADSDQAKEAMYSYILTKLFNKLIPLLPKY